MIRKVQKREDTTVRRKEIIDAARKLIVKYGIERVTLKRIAAEVGISEGAIYRHFKGKRDILLLLAEHIEENLMGDIDRGLVSGNKLKSLEILENIFRSHLSAVEQRKGISYQVIAEIISLGDNKLNKRVYTTINKYSDRIKNLVQDGITSGEIREQIDPDTAAMLYFGMVQGLVNIWALSGHSFRLDQKYEPMWDFFREAIIKR